MKQILLIEDDERLQATLNALLSSKFSVRSAANVAEATQLASSHHFDAVISDFILSDGDGFHILDFLNQIAPRPKLFFITAYAEKDMAIKLVNQKINGLIEKPFEFSHLMHFLEKEFSEETISKLPEMKLIPFEKLLIAGDTSVALTDVEFKILSYLFSRKNKWASREDLIQFIWGQRTQSRNTLDTHLSNLKKKVPSFKDDLKVIRGRGYCYSPE